MQKPINLISKNQQKGEGFRIENLKQKRKTTVKGTFELEYRKNVKINGSLLAFSNYRNSDTRNKINLFLNPKTF